MNFRVGYGIDVHRLEKGLPLIIGGVSIDSSLGAVGHSDADVLLHAICDAILGAACLGDIGVHFPDTNPQYKGIDSSILLSKSFDLVRGHGFQLGNLDCTVVLEAPKLNPYREQIRERIADILLVNTDQISFKATTHEKVDSFGEQKAIKAYAVCLLHK
jgi:2-C-methyl-D-erythritol 2,4-cyclodiphosphate synthase